MDVYVFLLFYLIGAFKIICLAQFLRNNKTAKPVYPWCDVEL